MLFGKLNQLVVKAWALPPLEFSLLSKHLHLQFFFQLFLLVQFFAVIMSEVPLKDMCMWCQSPLNRQVYRSRILIRKNDGPLPCLCRSLVDCIIDVLIWEMPSLVQWTLLMLWFDIVQGILISLRCVIVLNDLNIFGNLWNHELSSSKVLQEDLRKEIL